MALLTEQLDSTGQASTEAVSLYQEVFGKFGGTTSELPEERSALALTEWLKSHIQKLSSFVGGVVDVGTLAGATNFAKMLTYGGCGHVEGVGKESLSDPSELGATSDGLHRFVWNFMTSFWILFGLATARKMAEDHRAEVRFPYRAYSSLVIFTFVVYFVKLLSLVKSFAGCLKESC